MTFRPRITSLFSSGSGLLVVVVVVDVVVVVVLVVVVVVVVVVVDVVDLVVVIDVGGRGMKLLLITAKNKNIFKW